MPSKTKMTVEQLFAIDPDPQIKIDYSTLVYFLAKITTSIIEFDEQKKINIQEFAELCAQELIASDEADCYVYHTADTIRH